MVSMNNLHRLKPTVTNRLWGGNRLANMFNIQTTIDRPGEIIAAAGFKNRDTMVEEYKIKLSELLEMKPELFGSDLRYFPITVNLIDAAEDLSVQVHPGDEYALEKEGCIGCPEAWYVLDCDEQSQLLIGHTAQTKEEFVRLVKSGAWERLFRRISIKKGDFFFLPPGTIHSIGAGICIYEEQPTEITQRAFLQSKVSMEMLGKLRYNMHQHWDNVINDCPETAITEMNEFKYTGGHSIVDVTTYGISRDTKAVRRVAAATGLNIVMGTGLYIQQSRPKALAEMTETQLTELFIKEGTVGDENGVVSGLIGEIGISDETLPHADIALLEIVATVQRETGLSIMIHPPFFEQKGHAILDTLEKAGADLERVIFAHIDPHCEDIDYMASIACRGVCLEFDQFGMEFPCTLEKYERKWLPSDIQRIRGIVGLIDGGHVDRVVMSQDICFKAMLKKYGGVGYTHILENIVPSMRDEGVTDSQIRTIMIDNPMRLLTVDR